MCAASSGGSLRRPGEVSDRDAKAQASPQATTQSARVAADLIGIGVLAQLPSGAA
jgi:hypothetical protein